MASRLQVCVPRSIMRAPRPRDAFVLVACRESENPRRRAAVPETLPPALQRCSVQPVKGAEVEAFTNAGRHPCSPAASRSA